MAIPREEIFSVRELSDKHLNLLKTMLYETIEVMNKKYGLARNQIVSYFHYYPSVFQLHAHFIHVNNVHQEKTHVSKAILV